MAGAGWPFECPHKAATWQSRLGSGPGMASGKMPLPLCLRAHGVAASLPTLEGTRFVRNENARLGLPKRQCNPLRQCRSGVEKALDALQASEVACGCGHFAFAKP